MVGGNTFTPYDVTKCLHLTSITVSHPAPSLLRLPYLKNSSSLTSPSPSLSASSIISCSSSSAAKEQGRTGLPWDKTVENRQAHSLNNGTQTVT